ncbi:MAG: hypothetical protein ACWGOX_06350 [Desulforhopalus sp.]
MNISLGGFSFRCLCSLCLRESWIVDIIHSSGAHLQDIAIEKIWQREDNNARYASIYTRTIGVKFKALSPEQLLAIGQFL